MRYLCNLNVYITVEAATLIGLSFVAASSYIYRSVMARKKRSGAPKPSQPAGSTSSAVAAPKGGDGKGVAKSVVTQEVDTRPETSPYGSPACTIPFASPLTLPLDILTKSPKLRAAYESRLPELPAIPEDVGHVLVHYLHTGTYGSLKPKPTGTMSKQICELKTSIQAYAAARAYDLPDLMRLAEAKIDKYGKGLPLPALLEVARDAYPTLTEGDAWFLDYLRSRIRPHLKDPKSLLGSNLLDQISSILSPNRVLLRTVLELFCERIVVLPEPVASPAPANIASTIASPITSPGSSRPASPLPAVSPMSLLEMRSRAVPREEFPPARKNLKATPWPSPDNMLEASWARSISPEPVLAETAPPQFEAKPVPEPGPALAPFPELGPVILDVVPPPGPSVDAKAAIESEAKSAPEPEVNLAAEPETMVQIAHGVDIAAPEPNVKPAPEPEAELASAPETKVDVEPESKLVPGPEVTAPAEAETTALVEPEIKAELIVPDVVPVTQRERKDSGKGLELEPLPKDDEPVPAVIPDSQSKVGDSTRGIDLVPVPKELESIPELAPELEAESNPPPKVRPPVLREADSGFWEAPEVESGKEPAPSIMEFVPVSVPIAEPAHELESITSTKEVAGVDARDFAGPAADFEMNNDKQAEAGSEAEKDTVTVPPQQVEEAPSRTAVKDTLPTDALDSKPVSEELPVTLADEASERLADAAAVTVPETTSVEKLPEEAHGKEEDEAQPETEKIQEETVEPEAVAKPEPKPEPETDPSDHDDPEPTGSVEPKAAEPSLEPGPKPAGKPEVLQRANTDSAVDTVIRSVDTAESPEILGAKPTAEPEGAKTEADPASVQPCSAQVRQRSWKKRFLSLRYPVLFGRGM